MIYVNDQKIAQRHTEEQRQNISPVYSYVFLKKLDYLKILNKRF